MSCRSLRWTTLALVTCGMACSDGSATPTSPVPATSFTFASEFASAGAATRSFRTGDWGTIAATLTTVTPPVVLSIGVGIPRADGGGCSITTSVDTPAGAEPQLVVTAEPGTYCVQVSDAGRVRETVAFSVTVTYP